MITAPTKRSVKLDMAGGKADEITAQLPAGGTPPTSGVLRLGDVRVFHDKSYRLNLYLHPKDTNLASLDPKARGNLLLRTVTLWRAHHDGKVEVFVRPTAAQLANLTKGWIITVRAKPWRVIPRRHPAPPIWRCLRPPRSPCRRCRICSRPSNSRRGKLADRTPIFEMHILPMFRQLDRQHMLRVKSTLDLWDYDFRQKRRH